MGKAADFVRAPAEFAPVVRGLLDDVRVVQDFDAALSLWREDGRGGAWVTRDGEVLYASGVAVGGVDGAGPLRRRREIEGLRAATARLREALSRAEAGREADKARREDAAARLEGCVQRRREAEAEGAEVRREMDGLSGTLARLEEGLEVYRLELGRAAEEEGTLRAGRQEAEALIGQIGRERAEAEGRVEETSRLLVEVRERIESAAEAVASQREALAGIRARADHVVSEVRRLEERCAEIRSRTRRLEADAEADRGKREDLRLSDLQARERIRQVLLQREGWGKEAQDLEEAVFQDQAFLREMQERSRSLKDQVTALLEEVEAISAGLSELKVERDLLRQKAQLTYGIDLAAASAGGEGAEELSEEERESLREESAALQDRIRRMGEVNLGALSEFEQLNERCQFLKGQQEDLIRSIRSLHETIDRINRTTRQRFRAAFDAIHETFSEVFRRLFGGGRASLVLTDENNLLETGVDIVVQPPGKRLGNILLLSAGEKALTAIALLFAIFRYNPSPFCLLDEVDATLDDHNVGRFIDILRELSMKTQFIVITHNKRTMSFADVLYGVTMAEKGVSRMVSVELNQLSRPAHEVSAARAADGAETPPEAARDRPESSAPLAPESSSRGQADRWAEIEPVDEAEENGRPAGREVKAKNGDFHGEGAPEPDQPETARAGPA
ncbi:MAG: AAA family ATPase [Candidatus Tectomicrobia bacterium]|nr:AAA family ATPase [Candidatus Tectomicrobia bacterium]